MDVQPKESTGYSAPLVYKVFAVLEELARSGSGMGVSEISRCLNISKSTVYGITQALTDLEVIIQDPQNKKFRLGPTLVHLGSRALAGIDIRAAARPLMEELSREFRETIFLGTFDEKGITIIEKADSPEDLRISAPVGTRIPLYAGAAGKVFLAGLKDSALKEILSERRIPAYTAKTITDAGEYVREISRVRREGFATDFEEYIRGVNAICVPIPDPWGRPVAAMWMVGFSHSFNGEKMDRAVAATMQAAARISEMLGVKGAGK
ncbi:MAG: IclR family transcriptional regulator [Peptococcaceae bacterium]|nr:IclR family transcriptional regulator [Peptococcaceae bacterium]